MKKILLVTFMVFAAIFIISCSGDEGGPSNEAGASCQNEGEETCSQDYSQILICQDSSWQAKKACKLNFGQYCRQTAGGAFSCTDSGDSGNSTEPTTDPTDSTDDETSDSTDTEPNDTDPTNPTDDTEPVDDSENPADDTDPTDPTDDTDNEPEEPVVQDLETCADIFECMAQCTDTACNNKCYKRGKTQAQNDYFERNQMCPTYTELDDLKHCQELYVKCGIKGDESYGTPYGHAVINGSFPQIHEAGTNSFAQGTFTNSFVTGNFGSNGNIPDPTAPSDASFSIAYLNQAGTLLILHQTYNSNAVTGKTPDVIFIIDAHSPGTYSVGLGNKDNIQMYVSENTENEADACDHGFGYGYLELSGAGLTETYTPGANTINIKGEVDIYSYKNAPMYIGSSNTGDITNTNLVACQPK
ncbi:hypothetical protein J5690_01840 [bacterium]|nr:hypothetical protein [bacterium]